MGRVEDRAPSQAAGGSAPGEPAGRSNSPAPRMESPAKTWQGDPGLGRTRGRAARDAIMHLWRMDALQAARSGDDFVLKHLFRFGSICPFHAYHL